MSTSSVVLKLGGIDAIKRVLVGSTKFAMEQYEAKTGKELPRELKETLENFVDLYIGAALPAILVGKLDKSTARDALIRCLKTAGMADNSGWADCGIALFSIGITAYDAARSTVSAARVASIATASGVGAPAGGVLIAATFLYGVLMTTKDALEAKDRCDAAISKQAEKDRRPAAMIDGKGYGLGPVSLKIHSQKGAHTSLMS